MDELPRDDESAEQYAQRLRRGRRRRRWIVFGCVVAAIVVLGVYAVLTTKPVAKAGEACGGLDQIECIDDTWCWEERGICLQSCSPGGDQHCPAGTSCVMFDVEAVGESRWNGQTFACKPEH